MRFLTLLKSHFEFLPKCITQLETSGLTISETFKILDDANEKIQKIPGKIGKDVQTKLKKVLDKNIGQKQLREIASIIDGEEGELPQGWSASDAASLKYCPAASVDVERSFSVYKNILTDRRHQLTEENLSKMIVCNCFYNRN